MKSTFERVVFTVILVCLCLTPVSGSMAQETRLRKGDRMELSVPQRQELERLLKIDNRGVVSIPIIGEIYLEGMTVDEAQETILRKLRELYPSVQELTLKIMGKDTRRAIYVHGEVVNPGKYEFESAPDVWEAIREAGGATINASLEAVRLIRAAGEGRRTSIVNLQRVIDSDDFDSLPELRPGDTVIIPGRVVPYEGSGSVKVIGAVMNPAPYKLSEGKNLVDAILAAGGPAGSADLRRVKVIRRLADGATMSMQVDFNKYLSEGDTRHNPAIYPGDTVNVPRQNNYFRIVTTDPRFLLGLITAGATLTVILLR